MSKKKPVNEDSPATFPSTRDRKFYPIPFVYPKSI